MPKDLPGNDLTNQTDYVVQTDSESDLNSQNNIIESQISLLDSENNNIYVKVLSDAKHPMEHETQSSSLSYSTEQIRREQFQLQEEFLLNSRQLEFLLINYINTVVMKDEKEKHMIQLQNQTKSVETSIKDALSMIEQKELNFADSVEMAKIMFFDKEEKRKLISQQLEKIKKLTEKVALVLQQAKENNKEIIQIENNSLTNENENKLLERKKNLLVSTLKVNTEIQEIDKEISNIYKMQYKIDDLYELSITNLDINKYDLVIEAITKVLEIDAQSASSIIQYLLNTEQNRKNTIETKKHQLKDLITTISVLKAINKENKISLKHLSKL